MGYVVVMLDLDVGLARGKAEDLGDAGWLRGYEPSAIVGDNDYAKAEGSEVVVITAGSPRRPGISRDDLVLRNAGIIRGVASELRRHCPDAIVVLVTNPVEPLCHVLVEHGFPPERVVGMAGLLDSARFARALAELCDVSVHDVSATVLGRHGDSMVTAASHATVHGVPAGKLLSPHAIAHAARRTRDRGPEILQLLPRGSTCYGAAAAAAWMVRAIVEDERRVAPCTTLCTGQYGIEGVFLGMLVELGREGVSRVIEFELSASELDALVASADEVRVLVEGLHRM